jgi:diguanylate cyclase (GGDEF)-like protein
MIQNHMIMKMLRPKLSVGIKLLLSFTVVFWIPVILLTTLFFSHTESLLESESTKLARTHLQASHTVLNERFTALQDVLKNFSDRRETRAAFEKIDKARLHEELVRVAAINPHVQILLAIDNNFRVLAGRNNNSGEILNPTQLLSAALLTGKAVASLELVDSTMLNREGEEPGQKVYGSALAQLCIVPVKSGDTVIGAIMGGIILSNDTWVGNTVFDRFGVDVALFAGERIESSLLQATSSLPRSVWSLGLPMPDPVKEDIILGRSFSGIIPLKQGKSVVAVEPLRDFTSRIIGAIAVSQPAPDIRAQALQSIFLSLSITAVIGLLISLLITYIACRDITRPLSFIVDAMHQFGGGQIDTTVAIETGDEFEKLADGFNLMSDDIRRRENKLTKHYQVTKLLMSTLDLENLLTKMLEIVVDVTESQMGIIYLYEQNAELLVPSASFGVRTELAELKANEGYPGQAAIQKELQLIHPALDSVDVPGIDLGFTSRPPHQLAYIPLICKDQLLGLLVLGKVKDYGDEELTLFDYLATQLAIALDNAILHKHVQSMSITDALTGLYNRRFLNELMDKKWSIAVRHKKPLAVMMGDIDNFKSINDTHGHAAGDEVLRLIGQVIKESIRKEDLGSRYGGEEFVVVMENTSAKDAVALAERIAARLKDGDLPWLGRPVTISIGVAVFLNGNFSSVEELLQAADHSMYVAKAGGKDQVVLFKVEK